MICKRTVRSRRMSWTRRREVLSKLIGRELDGNVYRVIGSRFLQSPLASAGSYAHGGRFNPPGGFEVLYTALSADTALAEREGFILTAAGIRAAAIRTGVLLRIRCKLQRLLDLTDESVRQRLDLSPSELLGPWLPWNFAASSKRVVAPSQRLGELVFASRRFEAILSPSAKDAGGCCLAILPERLHPGSSVIIEDPEGTIRGALGLKGKLCGLNQPIAEESENSGTRSFQRSRHPVRGEVAHPRQAYARGR